MTDLTKLIARVEALTSGTRGADALLCVLSDDRPEWLKSDKRPLVVADPIAGYVAAGKNGPGFSSPRYTYSLDAAIALTERVLPEWSWETRRSGTGDKGQATVWNPHKAPGHNSEQRVFNRPSPAIALILATLKALAAKEVEGD